MHSGPPLWSSVKHLPSWLPMAAEGLPSSTCPYSTCLGGRLALHLSIQDDWAATHAEQRMLALPVPTTQLPLPELRLEEPSSYCQSRSTRHPPATCSCRGSHQPLCSFSFNAAGGSLKQGRAGDRAMPLRPLSLKEQEDLCTLPVGSAPLLQGGGLPSGL